MKENLNPKFRDWDVCWATVNLWRSFNVPCLSPWSPFGLWSLASFCTHQTIQWPAVVCTLRLVTIVCLVFFRRDMKCTLSHCNPPLVPANLHHSSGPFRWATPNMLTYQTRTPPYLSYSFTPDPHHTTPAEHDSCQQLSSEVILFELISEESGLVSSFAFKSLWWMTPVPVAHAVISLTPDRSKVLKRKWKIDLPQFSSGANSSSL